MDRWRQEPRLHDCLGVDDSGSLSLSPNVILQLLPQNCLDQQSQPCPLSCPHLLIVIGRVRRLFSGRQGWLMLLTIFSGWTPSRERS